ncbi:MAG: arylsulfatase [Verrucomicrobiae bacterium]|nr:arylsulfatase [Verrucomicrobiae bacterium]
MKAILFILTLFASVALQAAEHPNVIVILADDFGYGSAGCYGADPALVRTPSIDRLAKEGRRFTDANTTSSVCSPTRYSVLTGRYCWRTTEKSGVLGVFSPLHIEPTRLNLASLLKGEGYHTAAIGKWHLGYGNSDGNPNWRVDYSGELSPGPLDIGFDYHFSVPANHGDVTGVFVENRFVYGLRSGKIPEGVKIPEVAMTSDFQPTYRPEDLENARKGVVILDLDAPRRVNDRVMPVLTGKAVDWIEQQKADEPFFLYFTPVAAHNPITPSTETAGSSGAGPYGDWIHELDRSVGQLLDVLDRKGFAENTLVIFTADNGGVTGEKVGSAQEIAQKAGLKVNGDLRGRKHTIWEGGFKVPFLVRWPGHVSAGSVSHEMVSLVDLLATASAIVGKPLPPAAEAAEDSYNILPAILGEPKEPIRNEVIVHSSDGVYAIRKGQWKWIEGVPATDVNAASAKKHSDEFHAQLYHTFEDPAETRDVATDYPDVVEEMKALLVRYRDGGYSREMPPVVEKKSVTPIPLSPLQGTVTLDESLEQNPPAPWSAVKGEWTPGDDGLFGKQTSQKDNGATLRVPVSLKDGAVQYEISFRGADRHSLRIETEGREHSFRIEVSTTKFGISKNPSKGEPKEAVEHLAGKVLDLQPELWYPIRISFKGDEVFAEINGESIRATHPVFDHPKAALNFLVFGDSIGFRQVKVAKP